MKKYCYKYLSRSNNSEVSVRRKVFLDTFKISVGRLIRPLNTLVIDVSEAMFNNEFN